MQIRIISTESTKNINVVFAFICLFKESLTISTAEDSHKDPERLLLLKHLEWSRLLKPIETLTSQDWYSTKWGPPQTLGREEGKGQKSLFTDWWQESNHSTLAKGFIMQPNNLNSSNYNCFMQMDPESEYVVNSLKICSVIISDTKNGTKTVTSSHLKRGTWAGRCGFRQLWPFFSRFRSLLKLELWWVVTYHH